MEVLNNSECKEILRVKKKCRYCCINELHGSPRKTRVKLVVVVNGGG